MVLTIPERAAKATGTPLTGVTASDGLQRHVVAPGETPGQISTKYYGTSRYWKNILEANGIDDPTRVGAGTTLIIPDLKEATTPGPGPAEDTLTTRTPGPDEHVVKPGETLTEISHKYYGTGRYVKTRRGSRPARSTRSRRSPSDAVIL